MLSKNTFFPSCFHCGAIKSASTFFEYWDEIVHIHPYPMNGASPVWLQLLWWLQRAKVQRSMWTAMTWATAGAHGVTLQRFWKHGQSCWVPCLQARSVAMPLVLRYGWGASSFPLWLGKSTTSMVNVQRSRWCACLKTTLLACRAMDAWLFLLPEFHLHGSLEPWSFPGATSLWRSAASRHSIK